ncbi:hypothetical protein GOP47_0011826 [Adiantum capillus-veneris]|uniref:Serine aminopeptidase S33 domain-containing protein n=1 Tax=Adiantum capillus-veneris TaxID=13818 RepID=A0A9D4UTH5_ADICA|nr:hypothetical protein GOP47_0011826 [Adiantum capillus-veneris]
MACYSCSKLSKIKPHKDNLASSFKIIAFLLTTRGEKREQDTQARKERRPWGWGRSGCCKPRARCLRQTFRGHPVQLVYNSNSSFASEVLPQCRILHDRYSPTPWLCSSHLQTAFLHFFGRPPQFEYHRKLCRTSDGGTIALDWLFPKKGSESVKGVSSSEHDSTRETRIVVVIPGLTSDSADAYVKHLAHSLAVSGWRVVVANHRGLGGVPITSNQFYNAGWTEDLRRIINHVHQAYPQAPIFAVGTSIGANILVKYLGEEGDSTPLGGAAAICCPWDLLVCDRFICREWIQRFYDKILAFGLRSYAAVHQVVLSQIADWDMISKSRSVRDFDSHCTCVVGQYETVDAYYRKNSSAAYLHSVSVPLFCLSALDDPVCTKEAIPWDECRVNANVVLGITKHGGHLAFFEGLTADSIWWVRATTEFLGNLFASSALHIPHQAPVISSGRSPLLENLADKSPYLNIPQSGVVAVEGMPKQNSDNLVQLSAEGGEMDHAKTSRDLSEFTDGISGLGLAPTKTYSQASSSVFSENTADSYPSTLKLLVQNHSQLLTLESTLVQLLEQVQLLKQVELKVGKGSHNSAPLPREVTTESKEVWTGSPTQEPIERHQTVNRERESLASFYKNNSNFAHVSKKFEVPSMKVVARQNRHSLWLLAYIAIVTTWPLIGSALFIQGRVRLKNIFSKVLSK